MIWGCLSLVAVVCCGYILFGKICVAIIFGAVIGAKVVQMIYFDEGNGCC